MFYFAGYAIVGFSLPIYLLVIVQGTDTIGTRKSARSGIINSFSEPIIYGCYHSGFIQSWGGLVPLLGLQLGFLVIFYL